MSELDDAYTPTGGDSFDLESIAFEYTPDGQAEFRMSVHAKKVEPHHNIMMRELLTTFFIMLRQIPIAPDATSKVDDLIDKLMRRDEEGES